jgi:hypothetical protein
MRPRFQVWKRKQQQEGQRGVTWVIYVGKPYGESPGGFQGSWWDSFGKNVVLRYPFIENEIDREDVNEILESRGCSDVGYTENVEQYLSNI